MSKLVKPLSSAKTLCRDGEKAKLPTSTVLSPLLEHGLAEPLLEADLAESRVVGRNQRALAELGPEVPRVRVDDNLAGVVARAQALTDPAVATSSAAMG